MAKYTLLIHHHHLLVRQRQKKAINGRVCQVPKSSQRLDRPAVDVADLFSGEGA